MRESECKIEYQKIAKIQIFRDTNNGRVAMVIERERAKRKTAAENYLMVLEFCF